MPSFRKIDPSELPVRTGRESKVSAALVNDFVDGTEVGDIAAVELGPQDKSVASVRATLTNYVDRHQKPIRVFTRGGSLFMERLATWVPKEQAPQPDAEVTPEAPVDAENAA